MSGLRRLLWIVLEIAAALLPAGLTGFGGALAIFSKVSGAATMLSIRHWFSFLLLLKTTADFSQPSAIERDSAMLVPKKWN
jgi:hypothetical protein